MVHEEGLWPIHWRHIFLFFSWPKNLGWEASKDCRIFVGELWFGHRGESCYVLNFAKIYTFLVLKLLHTNCVTIWQDDCRILPVIQNNCITMHLSYYQLTIWSKLLCKLWHKGKCGARVLVRDEWKRGIVARIDRDTPGQPQILTRASVYEDIGILKWPSLAHLVFSQKQQRVDGDVGKLHGSCELHHYTEWKEKSVRYLRVFGDETYGNG